MTKKGPGQCKLCNKKKICIHLNHGRYQMIWVCPNESHRSPRVQQMIADHEVKKDE